MSNNIKGFHSLPDDKKKDQEEFSVGGGKSTTAVYRPTGTGNGAVDDIIRSARGQGPSSGGTRNRKLATITLYKNGFQIDDGEFRDAKDKKNQSFLDSLQKGEVPTELNGEVRKKWPNQESVGINLINKSQQTYEAPVEEKRFDFSQSKGLSLGSSSSSSSGAPDVTSLPAKKFIVDPDKKKTTIQIVLHNRQRVRAQFNQDATIQQLFEHVKAISGKDNFKLMEGFPPKAISGDISRTLREAKLISTSVSQRV